MEFVENKQMLKQVVDNSTGETLAHQQIKLGWKPTKKELLMMDLGKEYAHESIAHLLVETGKWQTEDPEILMTSRIDGWSVAHAQAAKGWKTEDPFLLEMHSRKGTVKEIQNGLKDIEEYEQNSRKENEYRKKQSEEFLKKIILENQGYGY